MVTATKMMVTATKMWKAGKKITTNIKIKIVPTTTKTGTVIHATVIKSQTTNLMASSKAKVFWKSCKTVMDFCVQVTTITFLHLMTFMYHKAKSVYLVLKQVIRFWALCVLLKKAKNISL